METATTKVYKFCCPRCDHGTDFKGNLISHLSSKKECKVAPHNMWKENISREALLATLRPAPPKLPRTVCEYCNKEVGKANYARHIRTCKENQEQQTMTSRIDISTHTNDTKVTFESHEEFEKAVHKEIKKYLSKHPVQNTYQTINNGTINIVNINSFGNENVSHINGDFLSYCIMNPKKGITQLIENIHYNDHIPENKNLRFKSSKRDTFEHYTGSEWIECDASYTLDELIKKGYRLMNNHYVHTFLNENPEYYEDPVKQSAVEKFRFLTDTKNIDYHLAKRNIRLLVRNKTYYVVETVGTAQDEDNNDNDCNTGFTE